MIDAIDDLLNDVGIGDCAIERVRRHVLSRLVCLGRHTITGLITTSGRQFKDWSAEYRLYAHQRIEPAQLFGAIRQAVLRHMPDRTVVIGRIRADAKLYNLPGAMQGRGRRRVYGSPLPMPEEIRKDSQIPWIRVKAFAAGKIHAFKIKTIDSVRWRASGPCDLRLIVIAPLGYRKTKNGRILYRKPAYLICTDPQADLKQVLQAYLWRWDIEVNFKEEKSILGIGQAKVRHPESVERVPALAVSAYGLLLTAAARAYGGTGLPKAIPPPKWRRRQRARPSTQCLINHLRYELWHEGMNLSHFVENNTANTKCFKINPPLESALYYTIHAG